MRGFFITMEGSDGAGKTVQTKMLTEYFKSAGFDTVLVREPGGTSISEQIRNIIIDKTNTEMNAIAEMLLYAAARAQLIEQVIRPSVLSGKIVICDRFVDSSIAYQSYARGLDIDMVRVVNNYAIGDVYPDITFFLDLDYEVGILRKKQDAPLDRLEQEGLEFHRKVYGGYKKLAKESDRIVTINAAASPDEIHLNIVKEIKNSLGI